MGVRNVQHSKEMFRQVQGNFQAEQEKNAAKNF